MLNKFYAVTRTSIYEVEGREDRASAVKIALRGESKVPVGNDLVAPGCMLAVCRSLQAYVPEKYGMQHPLTAVERRIENVNVDYWRGGSSAIVGLFRTKEEAEACFGEPDLQPADPRWLDSTREVLDGISDEHPWIYVCRHPRLGLLTLRQAS